jgi:hypothetical protein
MLAPIEGIGGAQTPVGGKNRDSIPFGHARNISLPSAYFNHSPYLCSSRARVTSRVLPRRRSFCDEAFGEGAIVGDVRADHRDRVQIRVRNGRSATGAAIFRYLRLKPKTTSSWLRGLASMHASLELLAWRHDQQLRSAGGATLEWEVDEVRARVDCDSVGFACEECLAEFLEPARGFREDGDGAAFC